MKKIFLFFIVFSFALTLFGYVVDDMESLWEEESDNGASVSVSKQAGFLGNANRIDYDFNSGGSWVQIKKDVSNIDLSSGDSIRFYVKGSGNRNNVEVKLFDEDGDIATYVIENISNLINWTPVVCQFKNFNVWKKSSGEPYGDGVLDTKKIVRMGFGVVKNEGGQGELYIDNVSLYQNNPPGILMIDGCEIRKNFFGGIVSTHTGVSGGCYISLSIESSSPSPKGGNYYRLTYQRYGDYDPNKYATVNEWFGSGVYRGQPVDASSYDYVNFYMRVKEDFRRYLEENSLSWALRIEVFYDSPASTAILCGGNLAISDFGSLSSDWKFYSIALSSFTSLDKSKINEIKFTFWPNISSSVVAVVDIDHIWFSEQPSQTTQQGVVKTIDGMDGKIDTMFYQTYKDKDAQCYLSSSDGYERKALKMKYSFNSGSWVTFEYSLGLNLSDKKAFRFRYKGEGETNNLELKIEDLNGTVFYRIFPNATNTSGVWQTVDVSFKDFSLMFKGRNGETNFDFGKIKTIYFAISKNKGGKGTVFVDELEATPDFDFVETQKGKIISQVSIDNNPFSPNNDGIKDFATFTYKLDRYAKEVVLEIYDLSGAKIKEIKLTDKLQGEHSDLVWDGKDTNDTVVLNGVYIYKIKVKDLDGKLDYITNLIGVLK